MGQEVRLLDERIHIVIDADLKAKLVEAAWVARVSLSELIRQILDRAMTERELELAHYSEGSPS